MEQPPAYEPPEIVDHGSLVDVTAACVGGGALDESFKGSGNPFSNVSPAFGDPAFCEP